MITIGTGEVVSDSEGRLRKGLAWCFRESGWSLREIGKYFDVTAGRARQLVAQAAARIDRATRPWVYEPPPPPPVPPRALPGLWTPRPDCPGVLHFHRMVDGKEIVVLGGAE